MKMCVTQEDLRVANQRGYWRLCKDTAFYIKRFDDTDRCQKPMVVIKNGTTVFVKKVYRRGRAALLCYIDTSGKVWWSWTHAEVFEPKQK